MAQIFLHRIDFIPALKGKHCIGMPLRYIYDNTEKSSNCNGFTFFTPLFRPLFQR